MVATKREERLSQQTKLKENYQIPDSRPVKTYLIWGGLGALVLAGLIVFFVQAGQPKTFDVTQACLTDVQVTFHIHPHLTIFADDKMVVIPANIGITSVCNRPLHTHDDSGTIHTEAAFKKDFTLGEFFRVWGKPISKTQVLDFHADDKHELSLTVDGKPSDAWENLVFSDKQDIVIRFTSKK